MIELGFCLKVLCKSQSRTMMVSTVNVLSDISLWRLAEISVALSGSTCLLVRLNWGRENGAFRVRPTGKSLRSGWLKGPQQPGEPTFACRGERTWWERRDYTHEDSLKPREHLENKMQLREDLHFIADVYYLGPQSFSPLFRSLAPYRVVGAGFPCCT
jgi:hypothetical protein